MFYKLIKEVHKGCGCTDADGPGQPLPSYQDLLKGMRSSDEWSPHLLMRTPEI